MALIKCPECGREISDKAEICPKCGYKNSEKYYKLSESKENRSSGMRKWRIISGIISIVFMILMSFLARNMHEYASEFNIPIYEVGSMALFKTAIFLLPAGIISLIAFKGSKGGNIAILVLNALTVFFGLYAIMNRYGTFGGAICTLWGIACSVVAGVSLRKQL